MFFPFCASLAGDSLSTTDTFGVSDSSPLSLSLSLSLSLYVTSSTCVGSSALMVHWILKRTGERNLHSKLIITLTEVHTMRLSLSLSPSERK